MTDATSHQGIDCPCGQDSLPWGHWERVVISADVPDADADKVFSLLCDSEELTRRSTRILRVALAGATAPGATRQSSWEVAFRDGRLVWTEHDWIDRGARTVLFQLADEGDFAALHGEWRVLALPGHVLVEFDACLDLGMASMAATVNALTAQALHETVQELLDSIAPGSDLMSYAWRS